MLGVTATAPRLTAAITQAYAAAEKISFEKLHKRKNVPEEEFLTQMHDQNNSLEIENLHTYFFSDVGTVRAVDGVSFDVPTARPWAWWASPAAASPSPACP